MSGNNKLTFKDLYVGYIFPASVGDVYEGERILTLSGNRITTVHYYHRFEQIISIRYYTYSKSFKLMQYYIQSPTSCKLSKFNSKKQYHCTWGPAVKIFDGKSISEYHMINGVSLSKDKFLKISKKLEDNPMLDWDGEYKWK